MMPISRQIISAALVCACATSAFSATNHCTASFSKNQVLPGSNVDVYKNEYAFITPNSSSSIPPVNLSEKNGAYTGTFKNPTDNNTMTITYVPAINTNFCAGTGYTNPSCSVSSEQSCPSVTNPTTHQVTKQSYFICNFQPTATLTNTSTKKSETNYCR